MTKIIKRITCEKCSGSKYKVEWVTCDECYGEGVVKTFLSSFIQGYLNIPTDTRIKVCPKCCGERGFEKRVRCCKGFTEVLVDE